MGTSGNPSWLLLRGLMLHTGKARKEDFREMGVALVYNEHFSVYAN